VFIYVVILCSSDVKTGSSLVLDIGESFPEKDGKKEQERKREERDKNEKERGKKKREIMRSLKAQQG